jgi:hypothetical protein
LTPGRGWFPIEGPGHEGSLRLLFSSLRFSAAIAVPIRRYK